MIDNKAIVVFVTLMTYQEISLYELTVKTKFSLKEVKEHLANLNLFLADKHYPQLLLGEKGYSVPMEVQRESDKIFELLNAGQVYLTQSERINLIYLYTFCRREFVSNHHYQDFLKVSKNTSLSDIKELRKKMATFHVKLEYTRSVGYRLVGREIDKHQLAYEMIATLLQSPIGDWALNYILASWKYPVSYEQCAQKARDYYQAFKMSPILDRLQECLYSLILVHCRYLRPVEHVETDDFPLSEQLAALSKVISQDILRQLASYLRLEKKDFDYFSLLLAACFEGEGSLNNSFFQEMTLKIITKMQDISLLNFKQEEDLISDLKRHLIPAYYRMKYGITNENDYTNRIKENYQDLFALVKQSLQPLADALGKEIPDCEIAYFVLHFGGYLKKSKQEREKTYRAVIICPNGVSSSLIIKENLRVLFPKIAFQGISRVDQLGEIASHSYDLIFSTIHIDAQKPVYLVPMLMTDEQTYQLFQLVSHDFPDIANDLEMEQLLKIISQYATITQEKELQFALKKFLRQDFNRKDVRPVLQELIREATYQTSSQDLDWKQAIRLAAQPLLKNGQITENYPEAMIKKVEEFGPFINLGKGIAIPHARPEDGVLEVGMSMLVLEKPIYLLDDPKQEIYLLICIAAIDNETHLKALSHLTTILRDKGKVSCLLKSRSYQDIKEIIKQEA
ncbi:BglG family transcription antiterminator [Streptococcus didelphis]|uniref:BglG family transcription antiterminator n=1 Tax=Streptococcus didelphis TaxID=102886 RepID=UPI000378CC08|nr:BglG family transcription antiterminator [Streptococcus didelphis]